MKKMFIRESMNNSKDNLKERIKRIKQNSGITLVALVVTIIVLLILAGVSIGLVFNNEVNSEDPTKGYFGDKLNTLYLKIDYVSNDTTLSSYTSYTPTDGGATMKKMNPKWTASSNSSS